MHNALALAKIVASMPITVLPAIQTDTFQETDVCVTMEPGKILIYLASHAITLAEPAKMHPPPAFHALYFLTELSTTLPVPAILATMKTMFQYAQNVLTNAMDARVLPLRSA